MQSNLDHPLYETTKQQQQIYFSTTGIDWGLRYVRTAERTLEYRLCQDFRFAVDETGRVSRAPF